MAHRLPSGSSDTVFLTEAKTDVVIPVRARKQGLDDHPQFIDLIKSQTSKCQFLTGTGLNHLSQEGARPTSETRRHQLDMNIERQRALHLSEKQRMEQFIEKERRKWEAQEQLRTEKELRIWKKQNEKITFKPSNPDYYEACPLQPGIGFFQQLLMHPKHSASGLSIRIPEMLFISTHVIWVKTDETSQGPVLRVSTEFRIIEFHLGFSRPKNIRDPIALFRLPGERVESLKVVPLNYEDLSSKLNAAQLPGSGIIQRYVRCHANRLGITRLFYHAQNKTNISSYAYSISASSTAAKRTNGNWILLSEEPGAIDVFDISGAALKEAIGEAKKIVKFLQSAYAVRIESIVLDFMKDGAGRLWLLGCKGVKVDDGAVIARDLTKRLEADMSASEIQRQRKDQQDEQQSSVHCRLCLLPYKPAQMTHVLPFKMLLLFKQHTSHSGRTPFDMSHLRVTTIDFLSHWVRLCDICYLLVLHEYELMETERKLANVLNIPAHVADVMNEPVVQQPNFMPGKMHQWRVLLYFYELEFLDSDIDQAGLYLQYSMFGDFFCYQLEANWMKEDTARYHITRLYYFFSGSNTEVRKFAEGCEAQFRVTRGKRWDHFIASGSCKPLSSFTCDLPDGGAICQPTEVLLFFNDVLNLKAKMVVGLARDREVQVRGMPISIYRHQNIYIPDPAYINSEPLPQVWMEVFDQEYKGLERTELVDSSEDLEEMYTPQLQLKDIYVQPIGGTRILHTNYDLDPFPKVRIIPPKYTIPSSVKSALPTLDLSPTHKPVRHSASHKPSLRSPLSLSTTSSSKVIYQLDSVSRLKSPTFLSPRAVLSPHKLAEPQEVLTTESFEELRSLFPDAQKKEQGSTVEDGLLSNDQLICTVSAFLRKRSSSKEIISEEITGKSMRHKPKKLRKKQHSESHQSRSNLKRSLEAKRLSSARKRILLNHVYSDPGLMKM